MSLDKQKNGELPRLAPPTTKLLKFQDKVTFALGILWLLFLLIPFYLVGCYRKIFPPPGKTLRGQVALVTGAGRGLGRGLALRLAREGCKVAVADVNKSAAEDTAAKIISNGGTAKWYCMNVAKVAEVKELQEAITKDLGPVDILVNNAGLIYADLLDDMTDEAIQTVIAVNLTSHFWMVRGFLPAMKERNSGHIVAISSIAGFVGGTHGTLYVATKFGVRGFMESLRSELNERVGNNIKTTAVFPYFINTSADYVKYWDLRMPAISIEEAVEAVIAGVKRDEVSVTVPSYCYAVVNLIRFLPQYIVDKGTEIVHVKINPATEEERNRSLTAALAKDFVEQ